MRFFELADGLRTLGPGGLARAPYLRESFSMFTTVIEAEWSTRSASTMLPNDATLGRMASIRPAFRKKFARAITLPWGIKKFDFIFDDLELKTQQSIIDNIAADGEQVRLDHFPEDIARILIQIVAEKSGAADGKVNVLDEFAVQATRVRYEKILLVRSCGCAKCGRLLAISSHGQQADSYAIVFLESDECQYSADGSAAVCKPCGEKYEFSHTPQHVEQMRQSNKPLSFSVWVDEGLVLLGLDWEMAQLLIAIHNLPTEDLAAGLTCDVMPMQPKLVDHNSDRGAGAEAMKPIVFCLAVLITMPLPFVIYGVEVIRPVTFAPVHELLNAYAHTFALNGGAKEAKHGFFSLATTKEYGTGVEYTVAESQIISSVKAPKHSMGPHGISRTNETKQSDHHLQALVETPYRPRHDA